MLNIVRADVGSFDLSFPGRDAAGGRQVVAEEPSRSRAEDSGHHPVLFAGDAGRCRWTPISTGSRSGCVSSGRRYRRTRPNDILEPMVSEEDVFAFHVYLIQHGRQVCKAQRPRCDECALAWGCPSKGKVGNKTAKRRRKRSAKAGR